MKTKEVKVESKTVKSQLIPQALIGKNGIRHVLHRMHRPSGCEGSRRKVA